ncbi:peroxisomal membrane protein PEX14-like isoform X1 [Phoenix dactylifera]|uniref:Peroxisomal membrane protein PEX14 n=1 Tax=Phoenix dactylifera TaxID=42345 RepID=A0A8B7CUM9_PHODC|nr:peroxisomal membrane protein PEX14-like isoform X1 [Phoenix dactylifera]
MSTQSAAPSPTHLGDNRQNPGPELSKPVEEGGQDVKQDVAADESSRRPVFAIAEPMREEQVQNAVQFLSHPKVRGSPVIYRHTFLEKKGLTKEEIDEAFRRVPDPPPNVPSVETNTENQGVHPQVPSQSSQPVPAPVGGVVMAPSLQQTRFYWSHAFLAVGVLAASGAGTALFFKNVVIPRLKTWIRKVVAEEKDVKKDEISRSGLAEGAAEAAKAAVSAAAIAAKASQELLNAKNEGKKYFEAYMGMLDVQVEEMKSLGNALCKLERRREVIKSQDEDKSWNRTTNSSWCKSHVSQSDPSASITLSKHAKVNGAQMVDSGAVRPSSVPASMEPAMPPHPKSFIEIMEMVQRGEKPPNIKEIDDMPPNPNQPIPSPLMAPRVKPWECTQQAQQRPIYGLHSQASSQGVSSKVKEDNSQQYGRSSDGSEPSWRRKTVRITEIESEADEPRQSSHRTGANERPNYQGWVPPQPPSIVMPEAAAAIRQPKSSIQKQESGDEGSTAYDDNGEDEKVGASDLAAQSESSGSVATHMNQSGKQEQELGIEAVGPDTFDQH